MSSYYSNLTGFVGVEQGETVRQRLACRLERNGMFPVKVWRKKEHSHVELQQWVVTQALLWHCKIHSLYGHFQNHHASSCKLAKYCLNASWDVAVMLNLWEKILILDIEPWKYITSSWCRITQQILAFATFLYHSNIRCKFWVSESRESTCLLPMFFQLTTREI